MQRSAFKQVRLWQAISRIPSLKGPLFLWQAELDDQWSEHQSLLTPTAELAAWTLANDGGTTCEVIEHTDGSLVAIDRTRGESFEVHRDSQIVCKLNMRKLADRIVKTLDGRIDFNSSSADSNVYRLGRLPPNLTSTSLYFCSRSDTESLLFVATALASTSHSVLLVPSLRKASTNVDSLADRFKTHVIALDELIVEADGNWVCEPRMLEELRNRLGIGETAEVNIFQLDGENYRIRFNGKQISLSNSVGLWYLRELISHPNQTFDPIVLESARTDIKARSSNSSTGEAIDVEARQQLATSLAEIEEDIAVATEFNDVGKLEKLQTIREELIEYVSKATGKGGRSRIATDASRARKNIRQQINRDMDRINKFCPELAQHFKIAFQGDALCYRPTTDPNWQF